MDLLRQHRKQLQQGCTTEEWVSSPLTSEALAIREALSQTKAQGYDNIELRSDAQVLIRAINGRDHLNGLFGIIQDIHNLTCHLSTFCRISLAKAMLQPTASVRGRCRIFLSP